MDVQPSPSDSDFCLMPGALQPRFPPVHPGYGEALGNGGFPPVFYQAEATGVLSAFSLVPKLVFDSDGQRNWLQRRIYDGHIWKTDATACGWVFHVSDSTKLPAGAVYYRNNDNNCFLMCRSNPGMCRTRGFPRPSAGNVNSTEV